MKQAQVACEFRDARLQLLATGVVLWGGYNKGFFVHLAPEVRRELYDSVFLLSLCTRLFSSVVHAVIGCRPCVCRRGVAQGYSQG